MKILYIITQADGGGAQKYVLALAKTFSGTIAAGSEATRLFHDAKAEGLGTYQLEHLKRNINPWHDFWAIWEIRELIKNLKPNIVHLNSTKAGILGSFAAIGLKTKVVFTAHGFRHNEPLPWIIKSFYLALEKAASSYRDYIICVSEADKKSALDYKLISEDKISIIYNGIPHLNFLSKEQARQELGLPMDKTIIGIIANDYKTKGLDIVAKLKPIPGTLIAVIGKTEKKSTESIKYLGYKDNAYKYLKAFDGILIPSIKEGFPFVALEALQAGQPIIATNVGGNKEAVGNAGIIISPNNPESIQEILETGFSSQIRESLCGKALARSKLFTEEKMLKETGKIYSKLLS